MPEIKKRVHTYKIDFICDVCGTGFYRPTGEALLSNPIQYPHSCTVCGSKMTVKGYAYPYIVTEEATE